MKNYISICKNVIASNNKRGWINSQPAIRVATSPSGLAITRTHEVVIVDKHGEPVARLVSTRDGKPVLKCGAKVVLVTEYPVRAK